MAQRIQIEMADKPRGTGTIIQDFTNHQVVPVTMRECMIRPEDIGPALSYINQHHGAEEDLMYLLSAILGE
ncbi:hypothetical protein [Nonomuraea sp. NPDC050786]|uniref:hypothetical protein n=1 Tax=Nonomuraea sp. NPDC050786 TaxID=3154840 RepID=UPI0033C63418